MAKNKQQKTHGLKPEPQHAHLIPGTAERALAACAQKFEAKELGDAWQLAMKAMNDNMDSPYAMYMAGRIAMEWDHPGLAANLFRRATALRPDRVEHWAAFGAALLDMRAFDAARECFAKSLELDPKNPLILSNLGALALNNGNPYEAIEWVDRALAIEPGMAGPMATRGFARLMIGDWAGFDDYRNILVCRGRTRRIYRQPEEPDWDGTKGQTVVLSCEQGLGDEISFASMVPDLIRDCAKVVIDCHPKLEAVFKRSFPEADVYGTRKGRELDWPKEYPIDASLIMSSLGHFYRKTDKDFPRKPWLVTDDKLRAKWRRFLNLYPGRHVGIAWTGGIFLTNRRGRSVTLEQFAPLLQPGATYFSLEYRDDYQEVKDWNASHDVRVVRCPVDPENYDDVLALLAELDHVMSTTTTVIHACGAIGKSCWVLVPSVLTSSQWRYGLRGDEMLWYPPGVVRMYRQAPNDETMGDAIKRMARDWRRVVQLRAAA
jgi:tetratricopeptide (TPR) repeat protein